MEKIKIVCSDLELGRKVIGKLAFDGIEAELIAEQVDIAYLDAKEELEAQQLMASKMSELYLENMFLVNQHNYLDNLLNVLNAKLIKQPMDISITTRIKKVQNDLEIIEPAMRNVNAVIFGHIERKFATDKRFQFCPTVRLQVDGDGKGN